jgi:hypothetical protein
MATLRLTSFPSGGDDDEPIGFSQRRPNAPPSLAEAAAKPRKKALRSAGRPAGRRAKRVSIIRRLVAWSAPCMESIRAAGARKLSHRILAAPPYKLQVKRRGSTECRMTCRLYGGAARILGLN